MLNLDDTIFFITLIIINFLFIKNYKYLGKKINIYDLPDEKRKIHKKPVPLLGGLIIYFNILLLIIYIFFKDPLILLSILKHNFNDQVDL